MAKQDHGDVIGCRINPPIDITYKDGAPVFRRTTTNAWCGQFKPVREYDRAQWSCAGCVFASCNGPWRQKVRAVNGG